MTIALSQLNFRDLGGLPVAGGRRIRPGALYRCQGPGHLTDDHRRELSSLGLRLVCDLRSALERAQASHDWGDGALLINLDLPNDFADESSLGWRGILEDPTEAGIRSVMRASYAGMPAAIHPHLSKVADAIGGGNIPLLIHCSAGKDRTGVLVALLLLFIGVPHDAVIADYLRSETFGRTLRASGAAAPAFEAMYGFAPDDGAVDALVGVDAGFLGAAIGAVGATWGSLDGYFAGAGIDGRRRNQLRSILTEDAG